MWHKSGANSLVKLQLSCQTASQRSCKMANQYPVQSQMAEILLRLQGVMMAVGALSKVSKAASGRKMM